MYFEHVMNFKFFHCLQNSRVSDYAEQRVVTVKSPQVTPKSPSAATKSPDPATNSPNAEKTTDTNDDGWGNPPEVTGFDWVGAQSLDTDPTPKPDRYLSKDLL